MLNLKSIKLYFFSIIELTILRLKVFYYKSSYYNKTLLTFQPERMFYTPSSFLISTLLSSEKEIYKITNISTDLVWEESKIENLELKNLHSFLWLTKIDRKNSRDIIQKIINSWIEKYYNYEKNSWDMEIVAKRIIAWTSNTDITLNKSDNIYKKKFFLSLIKQSNFLVKNIGHLPFDSSRIICVSAVILSGLIFKEKFENIKFAIKEIQKIISIYFDNSGFPKSRNPEEVFKSIQYMILVREWLKEAHEPIPEFLNDIIVKCGNCYNFFTNSHKIFPLFNGATEINHKNYDIFLKRLKYDFKNNINDIGGFYKIKENKIELFFDSGNPPSNKFSKNYQAGCLAFELISKGKKIICNTGYGKYFGSKLSLLSCSTAAHSTLCLNNSSSSRFEKNKIIRKLYGNTLIQTHKILKKKLTENEESYNVFAVHNGYEKEYGYSHMRSLKFIKKEIKICGIDELVKTKDNSDSVSYFIRFHIYPGIKVAKTQGGNSILISLENGEGWLLKSLENIIEIEKNIFLGRKKPINNQCICISGSSNKPKITVNWEIEKIK